MVAADKATTVIAGRDITAESADNDLAGAAPALAKLQVVYGHDVSTVMARNQLAIGRATPLGLLDPRTEVSSAKLRSNFYLYEAMPNAKLNATSIAGDLSYESALPKVYKAVAPVVQTQGDMSVVPTETHFNAGQGSVALDILQQMPGPQSVLNVLARDDVSVNAIHQFGLDSGGHVAVVADLQDGSNFYGQFATTSLGGDRSPVRIVAEQGDVRYSAALDFVKGVRMIAGRDIEASSVGSISLLHQDASESSLVQAGRDVHFSTLDTVGGLLLGGPGQLLMAAGRSIDPYTSNGIKASGNLNNVALPKGSADISVLAGVSFGQGDMTQATAAYFQLLGGLGGDAYVGMLYDQVILQRGQGNARPFVSLSLAERMVATRALVGDATYQAAVVRFMQQRYDASLGTQAALEKFGALTPAVQATVLGNLLTPVWVNTVPAQDRLEQALKLAGQLGNPNAQALIDFVNLRDPARQVSDVRAALQRFDALTVDQQALFVDKVLVKSVKDAIAQASLLPEGQRDAAQSLAYNAIDAVFPSSSTDKTHINMGASQIQTQQGSNITVLNPKGGINVGQLTAEVSSSKTASDLGIITAGGGDIGVVVRDDITVNTSRIFTLVKGDEVLWSSVGSIDAGRGAKTSTAAVVPVYYLDSSGKLQIDVTSAVSGSGILATGALYLSAPRGDINAGDAGIKADKIAVGGGTLVNADAIVTPQITGAPPAPAANLAVTAPVPQNATAAGSKDGDQDDSSKKKKRKRNILLDFLGFGDS